MNELSSRHLSLSEQTRVHAGLTGRESGTTHVIMTSDAMTRLDLTPNFDVTYLPRKIEELIEQTGVSRRTLFRNLHRIRRLLHDCIDRRLNGE